MGELADLLRQLVAIDSVNPDLVPGGGGEGEIARFVAGWLGRAGLEVLLQETATGRPNVVAAVKGTGGGRSLMLNAHLDTVGYAGMERPLEPYVEGNRLYGRGAFDMKGSLAAIMLAAAELAKNPPRGHVLVTAVTDEEYASLGTQAVVGTWKADAAIVTEPTGLDVCVAHKGFVWLDVETRGMAAHGSRPDLGIDAIAKMGKVLVGIEGLDKALRAAPSHPLLASGSIHASLIDGGTELSTYPDRCLLRVERRTIPGESADLVEGQLAGIVGGLAATDPHFKASVSRGLVREPFEVDINEPVVQLLTKHAAAIVGREPAIVGETGWMDSALLSAAGIPTVIFGPDGEGAHAAVEWVNLDHVEQCRQVYLAVAREFCA
ncbi:MAG: acetylornithine deacetylase [Thermomicrobiales bacterium]|jgi:acetylornithine deacetylase|nr:acetylornithine deacetylase [Thermomicrobiales bacterium]